MKLTGNKIILTGATSGVGLALLRQLHADGNTIVAIGRNEERLALLRQQFPDVTFLRCNLALSQSLNELILELREHHADANWLINNAGIQFNYTIGEDLLASERIENETRTNFTAAVQLCNALLPNLKLHPESLIVNVTSGLALSPKRSAAVYCATKAALRNFTKALRYQLEGSSVRVTELVLPLVDTPMTEGRGSGKISPEAVVASLLNGLKSNRTEIYPGKARLFRLIHRLLPALADRILKNG